MVERTDLQSQGAALESVLNELQREHTVKEISGWETGFANLSRAWTVCGPVFTCSSAALRSARHPSPDNCSTN